MDQEQKTTEPVGRRTAQSSWGPKLFAATAVGLLLFFWWLLIYSGGVVLHH